MAWCSYVGKIMPVNAKKLARLYREFSTVKAILDYFSTAETRKPADITYVDDIEADLKKAGVDTSRTEITTIFELLDFAGCGTYIRGARGKRSRIEWTVDYTSLAGIANGTGPAPAKRKATNEVNTEGPVEANKTLASADIPKKGSLKNLDQIRRGMTYADIVALLGREGGTPDWAQSKEPGHKTYTWGDERNRWIYFVTVNEHAVAIKVSMASID